MLRAARFPTRPLAALASVALTATALLGLSTASSPRAAAAGTDSAEECRTAAPARVRPGAEVPDPHDLTRAQALAVEREVSARLQASRLSARSAAELASVTVDAYVHVITRDDGTGGVAESQIQEQVAILNEAYAGRTAAGIAPTDFQFVIQSIDYTANSDWFDWAVPGAGADTDDIEAKTALHQGGLDDLNIYVAALPGGVLGYANYPWDTTVVEDGLVLLNESLPGGSATGFNEGDTATHEIGHWLGLAHTFENGCAAPGDWVDDTPDQAQGSHVFSCDVTLDTCPAPGQDPVHNFMSYGNDLCMDHFSPGQSARMGLVWQSYRAGPLLP